MKHTRLFVAGLLLAAVFAASAQPTSFTYQGVLGENGVPASGQYDLLFTLRDAATVGNQIGVASNITPVSVTNGHFTVTLDFGAVAFNGASRWLELGVRRAGSAAAHVTLSPRQPLGSAPYAIQALTAASVSGNISDSQISPNFARLNGNPTFIGAVSFNPVFGAPFAVGNSNKIARLNADYLDGLDSASFAPAVHAHGAGDITSGSLGDGRLSANVPLLDKGQRFTGSNTFAGSVVATNSGNLLVGSFSGSGAGLSNLNAASLSGLLPVGSLPSSAAQLGASQTFSGAVTFAPPAGAPFRVGSTTLVTNLNADLLDGVNASSLWNTGGNSNTAGVGFLGTLDNSAFELRVNNQRALRLVPGVNGGPILIANPSMNTASATAEYSTIAGGSGNSVQASGSFIGGGSDNVVTGGGSVIMGGSGNRATNNFAVVPGGIFNLAGGQFSFAAGRGARATNDGTFVWGDSSTAAFFDSTAPNQFLIRATGGVGIGTASPAAQLHVAGRIQAEDVKLTTGAAAGAVLTSDASGLAGWSQPPVRAVTNGIGVNTIAGFAANGMAAGVSGGTIAGGGSATGSNYISAGNFGTISGGLSNRVGGSYAVVAGGAGNSAAGESSGIGGGVSNQVTALSAYVGGGFSNRAAGVMAVVAGGEGNQATGSRAVVAGGSMNLADGLVAGIGGGTLNRAAASYAAVAGGFGNTNTGYMASIGGGMRNLATNDFATVPGGAWNIAGGFYSFAAGTTAQALHQSTFVWSDSSAKTPFSSTAPNQFLIRAAGGVGIGGVPQDAMLDVEGTVRINDYDLFLRGSAERGTGLGYYGPGVKAFGGLTPDGPVVYGATGGILGTTTGGNAASLYWNSQQVGIGTTAPQERLGVAGGVIIDQTDRNDGTIANGLRFGNSSGEGIASKRTATGNQWGLDLYTGSSARMSISYSGLVGIGTTTPSEILDVKAWDPTFNLHNIGDGDIGGYMQNTYGSVQLGMFNAGTGAAGQLPAGVKRAFFGMDFSGKVGSMVNTTIVPSFRNLLDDGSGNLSVLGGITAGGWAVISGGLRVNSTDLYLRGGSDLNHGLGWYGPGRPFGAYSPDGPVVYGYGGGALGTVAPGAKGLLIRNVALTWDSSLRVGIGRSATANRLEVEGEASKTTSGSWAANSDARIKSEIAGITNALDTLDRVRLVSFNYSDAYRAQHPTIENHRYLNVVAQEFQLIFPDYVRGSGEKLASGEEILQVDTYPLTIYSAAAIQELRREVGAKEERIRLLEQKNSALEDRLAALERAVVTLQAGAGK